MALSTTTTIAGSIYLWSTAMSILRWTSTTGGTTFAERSLLFHNEQGKKFQYVPPMKGSALAIVTPARGAAFGDLFNDGKIDVVINPIDGPAILLRNVNPDQHHWVEMKLVGGPKSPRDAVCSTVYLKANGVRQRQDVLASGSYISANDQRLHLAWAMQAIRGLRKSTGLPA